MKLTSDEIHSFVIGFFESLCPWPARKPIGAAAPKCLEGEYHYYLAGRGTGFIALLLILVGVIKLAKEVLT
ncbi:unnamed protein product [marine sediment metagenome]|uniref:Uncharacterized protein n=1 Tax=marine sediment metagenome TaxID=412755 RepID=X1R2M6_9ZZZZ